MGQRILACLLPVHVDSRMRAVIQAAASPRSSAGDSRRLARHVLAARIYRRLHEALEAAGVDHLVLKGPHLAAMFYQRPWHRGYNDLDILVRPAEFELALDALVQAGFRMKPGGSPRQATRAAAYDRELNSDDGSVVELHRDLSPYRLYALDQDGLFERAVAFKFDQIPAKGLSPEDLLVHLVIHAAKSQFSLIERKHLRDIRVLLAAEAIDWAVFERRAAAAGCRYAAWFFLQASGNLENAQLPEETMAALSPGWISRGWAGLWLDFKSFPLLRYSGLPKILRRLLLAPALVDRTGQIVSAGARFFRTRMSDYWLWLRHRPPGV